MASARDAVHLQVWQAAECCHTPADLLMEWESGEAKPPVAALQVLSELYGVTIDWLVCWDDTPTAPS